MVVFSKINKLTWQTPDEPVKGGSGSKSSGADSSDEDFGVELSFSPEHLVIGNKNSSEQIQTSQVQPPAEQKFALNEPSLDDGIPSLQVGAPGEFHSNSVEHGFNLATQGGALTSGPSQDGLMMVDDPMPELLGGGNGAAVQDMFVAEVLKGVQGFETAIAQVNGVSTSSVAPEQTSSGSFTPESQFSGELSLGTGELTTPTFEPHISSIAQPDSPMVADLGLAVNRQPPESYKQTEPTLVVATPSPSSAKEVSKPLIQGTTNVAKPEAKQAAPAEKNKATSATKAAGTAKEKPSGEKKNPAAGKGAVATAKGNQGAKNPLVEANPSAVAAPANTMRGLPKDLRIALGGFVISAVIAITLVVMKQFKNSAPQTGPSAEVAQVTTPSTEKQKEVLPVQEGPADVQEDEEEAPDDLPQSAQASAGKAKPSQAKADVKGEDKATKKMSAKDRNEQTNALADELDSSADDSENENLLTRPVTRFNLSNRALAPLTEISIALDRVQPRKALVLLKNVPADYATRDPIERAALRELTARYYLQVGALSKALTLFRQVCADPGRTSEVESCLHAARALLLTGSGSELKEMMQSLNARMAGQQSQWREWAKLLDVASALPSRSLEAFMRFTDEMIDKGPFMTSEWNLQLSGYFAKNLLAASNETRLQFLQSLNGVRRKSLEVRLAPSQYGPDIGSYMLPSVLNILLRNYEMSPLVVKSEEPETDSEFSLTAWIFNIIAQSKMSELRQTRARLAPLFGERTFAPLARVIEGHLAAQSGDFLGANAMVNEQIGLAVDNRSSDSTSRTGKINQFVSSIQRFRELPFLYVEWMLLGVKVAAGLNDKEMMRPVVFALDDARKRFPDLAQDFQYWTLLARGYRVLGNAAAVEAANKEAEKLAFTIHERGFVAADKIWLLMKRGKKADARGMMRQSLREFPYHLRILESGAEFAGYWAEDPSSYLKLESEAPGRFENRGRDRALLSFFTMRKLLEQF